MKVLSCTEGLDKRQQHKLYRPLYPVSMKDVDDGTVIRVTQWMEYEDLNQNGDTVTLLAIYDGGTETTYQTNSQSFKREFHAILSLLGDEDLQIIKKSGISRAGRTFLICLLA